ncbi:SOS response-associated peptidase family protein [Flavobacterium sp. LB2P74]|uniref:SOS response-associated peptidase family protein n=1 Tax=Flavobacterium sp. LB2P74 TaxID=3401717 RepID=UPI003AAE3E2A
MVNNKRCLVIASGYYEWQSLDPKGKVKQKYELCLPKEDLFTFADAKRGQNHCTEQNYKLTVFAYGGF